MSNEAQALALLQQALALLEQDISAAPVPFGPATLVSISPVTGPFGPMGYTLVFQPTAGGSNLTLNLNANPPGAVVNAIYTGTYTAGVGTDDTLNSLVPAAIQVNAVIVTKVAGNAVTFLSTSGGSPFTLNFQSLPAGITQGAIVSFSYVPASANGTGYDEVGSVTALS
jgi:hypothetical protein